ncbi:MAG: hypothetical protein AABX82_04750 [Nanoarchaeota archaeon]
MSIFDLFGKRTPFEKFSRAVIRLKNLLNVMKEEARREHFEQLKGHFHAVQRIVGSEDSINPECLIHLITTEKKETETKPDSDEKLLLKKMETESWNEINAIVRVLLDSLTICDQAISSRQNPVANQKNRDELEKRVVFLQNTAQKLNTQAENELKEYKKIKELEKKKAVLPPAINMLSSMSNGWKLNDIQRVVRQLGAWVEPAGTHAYKIVIPWASRPHTLSKDLDPKGFAQSLAKLLGIPKQRLVESFNRGELVE